MKSARDLLEDILAECRFLDTETAGLDEIDFVSDEVKKRAFARSVEIIGEAVKGLPNDLILAHPTIPWRRIASMRDRLIHAYSVVDYGLLFDVATQNIPTFKMEIEALVLTLEKD
jgi:uncharacterized protein with HEPN domain